SDFSDKQSMRAAIGDVPERDAAVEEQHAVVVDVDGNFAGVVTTGIVSDRSTTAGARTDQHGNHMAGDAVVLRIVNAPGEVEFVVRVGLVDVGEQLHDPAVVVSLRL